MKKICAVIFFASLCLPAFAGKLEQVNKEIKLSQKQDIAIGGQIKQNEKEVLSTKKSLVKTAKEITRLEQSQASVAAKMKTLEKKRAELTAILAESGRKIQDAAAGILAISLTDIGFDSESADDYILTGAILSDVSEKLNADIKTANRQIKELDEIKRDLESEKKKNDEFAARQKKEQAELDKLLRQRSQQNAELRGRQAALKQKIGALSAQAKDLAELADKIAAPAAPSGDYNGKKLRFPATGKLQCRFGEKTRLGTKSDGWYVQTRPNAIVVAPADGRIEYSDWFRKSQVIIINHNNGYISLISGMGSSNVLTGQEVLAGEPIAKMPSDSPEIYMVLRRGAYAIDPAIMFIEPR